VRRFESAVFVARIKVAPPSGLFRHHEVSVLATPGLAVNEKVVCAGRIPDVAEVTTWLAGALV